MTSTVPLLTTASALVATAAYLWHQTKRLQVSRRSRNIALSVAGAHHAASAERLDEINRLTDRNVELRRVNRDLTAKLAAFENAKARQIAQCKANAAKGGRARAAKRLQELKEA